MPDVHDLLTELGAQIEDPPHDGLAEAVRVRIAAATIRPRAFPTRLVPAAAVLAVLATVVVANLAGTRDALADWFGLRGVRVEQHQTPSGAARGARLDLGERVTLGTARRRMSFEVLTLPADAFGPPDEVYAASSPSGGRVSTLYRARPALPALSRSDIGLLLTEFRARVSDPAVLKLVGRDTHVEAVTVGGQPGLWFTGPQHAVTFADEQGRLFSDAARLSGNTLLFERGPVTLRIESSLARDETIRLAERLAPR